MPNLIETYARCTGLKIDKPWLKEDFFPVSCTKFITLSAGSGQAAKNYDYFQHLVDLLNPVLSPLGINIIQLGDDKTPLLSGTYDLRGKMNIAQSTNLIRRAICHIGVDSWSAHASGALKAPLVAIYGTTSSIIHGPHWKNQSKTILLESHRNGKNPTFGAEGNPKSINLIQPEEIANSIFKILELPNKIDKKTFFIGQMHSFSIFDVVPNSVQLPNLSLDIPFSVRMDLEFNEQILLAILQTGRKVTIVTKKEINIQLLTAFRQNILSYNHEIDISCPTTYPSQVKSLIPNSIFFSREKDSDVLSKLRFYFFDHVNIEQVNYSTRSDFVRESASYLNKSEEEITKLLDNSILSGILSFKTNKFILSNGSVYLSYSDLASGTSKPDFGCHDSKVTDSELFWRDLQHYYIYEEATKS